MRRTSCESDWRSVVISSRFLVFTVWLIGVGMGLFFAPLFPQDSQTLECPQCPQCPEPARLPYVEAHRECHAACSAAGLYVQRVFSDGGCQCLSNTKGLELYNPQPCKE